MLTNSKIALSVALVLATASAAMAAPKHPVRHKTGIRQHQAIFAEPWPDDVPGADLVWPVPILPACALKFAASA
jgi:hypothetical protein